MHFPVLNFLSKRKLVPLRAGIIWKDMVFGIKDGKFPEDESLKCFTACLMQLVRVLKDGHIELDKILFQIEHVAPDELVERLKTAAMKCAETITEKHYEDPCEISFNFVKCVYELDSEIFVFM